MSKFINSNLPQTLLMVHRSAVFRSKQIDGKIANLSNIKKTLVLK